MTKLKANEAFIDNISSEQKMEFIKKHDLGEMLPKKGHSGICTYAKVAFKLKRLEEVDPEGMKLFYKEHPELQQ